MNAEEITHHVHNNCGDIAEQLYLRSGGQYNGISLEEGELVSKYSYNHMHC